MKLRVKIYGLLLSAILFLGACGNDSTEEPNYIQFGVSVLGGAEETRGTIIGREDDQEQDYTGNMRLYGICSGSVHVNNETVPVSDGKATSRYEWPPSAITFYAFADDLTNQLSVTPSTSLINCGIGTYTIPTASTSQWDLLFGNTSSYATPVAGVGFQFKHVLSRITFQAKKEGFTGKEIKITKISIVNAANDLAGTLSNSSTFAWGAISGTSSKSTFEMPIASAVQTVGTTISTYLYSGTTVSDNSMFLFPHSTANFTTLGTQLKVEYTVDGTAATPAVIALKDITGNVAWTKGKWINYQITLKKSILTVTATVKDWTKPGQSVDLDKQYYLKASVDNITIATGSTKLVFVETDYSTGMTFTIPTGLSVTGATSGSKATTLAITRTTTGVKYIYVKAGNLTKRITVN